MNPDGCDNCTLIVKKKKERKTLAQARPRDSACFGTNMMHASIPMLSRLLVSPDFSLTKSILKDLLMFLFFIFIYFFFFAIHGMSVQ